MRPNCSRSGKKRPTLERIKWQWEEQKSKQSQKLDTEKACSPYAPPFTWNSSWFFVCAFYAGINHLYNHKSHAVWMHKTLESRLSFRLLESTAQFCLIFSIVIFYAPDTHISIRSLSQDAGTRASTWTFSPAMINCDSYLQPAMLHFDFAPNLIDCELRTSRRQHHFHAANAPPEIEEGIKKLVQHTSIFQLLLIISLYLILRTAHYGHANLSDALCSVAIYDVRSIIIKIKKTPNAIISLCSHGNAGNFTEVHLPHISY